MKRKYSLQILLLCTFLISVSCLNTLPVLSAQFNTLSTPIPSYGLISYSSAPTSTPMPTSTPTSTPMPTSTPTSTSTPMPTSTPTSTPTPTPKPTSTPQSSSTLHVDGNKLKDASGNTVILQGVVYQSVRWYATHTPTESDFTNMQAMGCNSVHIEIWLYQLYRGDFGSGGLSNPSFLATLDNIVSWATKHNLYVVLSLTCAGAFPDGHDTNDLTHLFSKYDTFSNYLSYWQLFANRYKSYSNILYCPFVEPLNCNYPTYTSYVQQVIDTVRTYRSDAICVIEQVNNQASYATGMWNNIGFYFQQSNPINRNNIMFAFDPYGGHMYPDNSVSGVRTIQGGGNANWLLANGFPVCFLETGGDIGWHQSYSSWDTTWINSFNSEADSAGYSGYFYYNWATDASEGLLSDWNGALRTYGNDVKNYYLSH